MADFIEILDTDEWEVETPSGWKSFSGIGKTVEYEEYELILEDGLSLICADDHIIIDENGKKRYTKDLVSKVDKVQTKDGPKTVESINNLNKTSNMFDLIDVEDDNVYYTNEILSHNSTSVIAFVLWYALFNPSKTVFMLANKGDTARSVLFGRFVLALENIPFFLQPGTKVLNKSAAEFSNGTRVLARATSNSSIRGESANLILLDEFGFVERADEFYNSTFPVISSGKSSKVIIVSTANGMGNVYHRLWQGAVTETNDYAPFTINWWDVPGRDQEWKEKTIRNSSQEQFAQEFENSFLGSSSTLINGNTLLSLKAQEPIHILDGGSIRVFRKPEEGHEYIMTVDVSKGRGQDHSTFNIIDISTQPFEQVAVFQSNTISPLIFPNKIEKYAKTYNNAFVVVESNDNGIVVCNSLFYDLEYDNQFTEMKAGRMVIGAEMNKKIKSVGCSNIKDLIEEGKLIIYDKETIKEMCMFVQKGRSYEAEQGNHDDLMMNLVMFGWFSSISYFEALTDIDLRHELYEESIKQMEEELLPFGIIDTGESDVHQYERFGGQTWQKALEYSPNNNGGSF